MPAFLNGLIENRALTFAAAAIAFLVALLLILLVFRLAFGRRLRMPGGRTRQPRLGIVDAFDLDGQRQLVLVRRDNVEHLIMIGNHTDILIESEIVRADVRELREGRGRDKEAKEAAQAPAGAPAMAPPKPAPKKGGGSRIGDDFLKGLGSGDRAATGSPAATFGPAEAASLRQAIARQIKPHWSAPEGVDIEKLVTVVRFRLDRDGNLIGNPTVVSQSGITPSNAAQKGRHAEQAIRAIRLAAPFDLPEQFYDQWKVVNSQFDRRLSQ